MIPEGVAAIKAQQAGKAYDQTNFNAFAAFIERFQFMSQLEPPLILPPINSTEWRRMGDALLDAPRGVPVDEAMHDYAKMAGALAANQPDEFNAALKDYISILVPTQAKALAKARAEVFFNQMEPFYNAMVIYVLAGLLAIFSWFNLSETLRRSRGVADRAGVSDSHHGPDLPHGAGRPAAGDESLFLRHLHRLGRGACWA